MLMFFMKAAKKIADQPGMVLYGNPPRWHQFQAETHDPAQVAYHAKSTYEIQAAKHLAKQEPHATHDVATHIAKLKTHAAGLQAEATQSAAVSMWKQALLAGKAPTAAQAKAMQALAKTNPDKAAALIQTVLDHLGADKAQALMAEATAKITSAKPKAAGTADHKDAALAAAIDHLEADAKQGDIPAKEQQEDAALVAKLKAAKDAPTSAAAPKPAAKPKVVVKPKKAKATKDSTSTPAPEPTVTPAPAPAAPVDTAKTVLQDELSALKLPATNTNAKGVNAKIAKLAAMVQAGDHDALTNEKFGSNIYQKKLAKFAAKAAATLAGGATPPPAKTVNTDAEWAAMDFFPDQPAAAADSGPHDGDTKAGAQGGTLVFKNGRWHLQGSPAAQQDTPAAKDPVQAAKQAIHAALQEAKMAEGSNVNAKVFNKKLDKLSDLVTVGDIAALQQATWGSNTYGKALAKFTDQAVIQLQAAQEGKPPPPLLAVFKKKATATPPPAATATPAAQPDTPATVTLSVPGAGSQTYTKLPNGSWVNKHGSVFSPTASNAKYLALEILHGNAQGALATGPFEDWEKTTAAYYLVANGMSPVAALTALFPPADTGANPDGATHGVEVGNDLIKYVLQDGKWQNYDHWQRSVQQATGPVTVKHNGVKFTLTAGGWEGLGDHYPIGTSQSATLKLLAGMDLHDDDLKSLGKKSSLAAADDAMQAGVDPVTAMTQIFPPGDGMFDEGEGYGFGHHLMTLKNGTWVDYTPKPTQTVDYKGKTWTHNGVDAWDDGTGKLFEAGGTMNVMLKLKAGMPLHASDRGVITGYQMDAIAKAAVENEGLDPSRVMNQLFPDGGSDYSSGDEVPFGNGKSVVVLLGGSWHAVVPQTVSGNHADHLAEHVNKLSKLGYTNALLSGKVPTKDQHHAYLQALTAANDANVDMQSLINAHNDLINNAIGKDAHDDLKLQMHTELQGGSAPAAPAAVAAPATQDPADEGDDWEDILFGDEDKQPPTKLKNKVTLDDGDGPATYVQDADGLWTNEQSAQSISPYGAMAHALDVLSGKVLTADQLDDLPFKSATVKILVASGLKPSKALQALFPPGTQQFAPQEGDTKTINGIEYQLINGRWHRVTPDAATTVTQAMQDAAFNAAFASTEPLTDLKDGWAAAVSKGQAPTLVQAGSYEMMDGQDQNEFLGQVVEKQLKTLTPAQVTALSKQASDAGAAHVNAFLADQFLALHAKALQRGATTPPPASAATPTDTAWKQTLLDSVESYVKVKVGPNNSNYKAVASKAAKFTKLLMADDMDGLAAATWGTNTYGKQFAKFAQQAVAQAGQATSTPAPAPAPAKPTVAVFKPGPAPAPAPATPDQPADISGWTAHPGTQGGYNPGGEYTDPHGQKWYVKFPGNDDATRTEVLANALYAAAGAYVPELKLVTQGGKLGIASKWVVNAKVDKDALVGGKLIGLYEQFATDAWLANYDVVGNNPASGKGWDNITNHKGAALRVEAGGALDRKGTGGSKPFGDQVTDLNTFRDPKINARTAAVFGKMTDAQIAASVANVANIGDETIHALVDAYAPGDADYKAQLAATLIARRDDMVKQYPAAAPPPVVYQAPTVFHNSNGKEQKWVVLATSPDHQVITVADKNNAEWLVTLHPSPVAAKHALLQQKFREMFGLSDQNGRLVETNGQYGVAIKKANGKPGDDAVRTVLASWWHSKPAATLTDALQPGVEQLALLNNNQIDEMIAKVNSGDPQADALLADRLKLSRSAYLTQLQVRDPWSSQQHVDESKLVVDAKYLPEAIDFSNYKGSGKGLSSKDHLNKQNTIDDAALIAFAQQGNLTALKEYQYDAYDKESGAYLGKKPILEHPNKDIKGHYAAMMDMLTSIANPPIKSMALPSFGSGDAEDVSEDAGYFAPGENIHTIPPEKVLGFWMKLGHVGADLVADLKPPTTSYFKLAAKTVAKSWYSKLTAPVKTLINAIQDSGANNRFWNEGKKSISLSSNSHSYSGPVQALANQTYQQAATKEEGTVVGRWMNMDQGMMDQLLQEGPGLVFQNADTMCCSLYKDWGKNAHFGTGAYLNIRYAKGAKALDSFGSGRFNGGTTDANGDIVHQGGEMEVTTLMGQRFVVLGVTQGNASDSSGITLDLLMLPPHAGYLAELDSQAKLGKSILVFIRRRKREIKQSFTGAYHALAHAI